MAPPKSTLTASTETTNSAAHTVSFEAVLDVDLNSDLICIAEGLGIPKVNVMAMILRENIGIYLQRVADAKKKRSQALTAIDNAY